MEPWGGGWGCSSLFAFNHKTVFWCLMSANANAFFKSSFLVYGMEV